MAIEMYRSIRLYVTTGVLYFRVRVTRCKVLITRCGKNIPLRIYFTVFSAITSSFEGKCYQHI